VVKEAEHLKLSDVSASEVGLIQFLIIMALKRLLVAARLSQTECWKYFISVIRALYR
jgi:hypothetical protein